MEFPIPATVTPMYDPEATIIVNSGTYYSPEYKSISAQELTRNLVSLNNLTVRVSNYEQCSNNARDYLIENYDEIGSEHADELARLLSIDLTQSIEVEFEVKISATILVPAGKSFDDLSEYDFDITLETNEHDYEVEEFDAEIYRMRPS